VKVVVTGASTGIGGATVRLLQAHGHEAIGVARRKDRLQAIAEETGCSFFAADLTVQEDVDALRSFTGPVDSVVNNAGGALGVDSIADADPALWQRMYDMNVMTALRVADAYLPDMRKNGGDLVFLTSTAAHATYPGGGGYVAAKHAERIIANTLRQELLGEPVRIIEIAPGLVKTEEFSLNRLGDKEAAEAVYAGVENPLVAADVAEAIVWALERPKHVNIDSMTVRPLAQASNMMTHRS
jgi:Short-chain alcohol dehydrogenase of unknown specificity